MSFDCDNADFIADKLEAELLPSQEIREAFHNELEAVTRRSAEMMNMGQPYRPWIRVGIDWTQIDAADEQGTEPVWRLSVMGNGDGMTRPEVEEYAKTLAVSGANNNQGRGGNQGMGLKISGPTRHPAGVSIRTLRLGQATMCRLGRHHLDGYGFLRIGPNGERTIDITNHIDAMFPPEIREAGSGTVITFHGTTGDEHTFFAKTSNWLETYLNTRYAVLDPNVDIMADVPVGTSRDQMVPNSKINQDIISKRLPPEMTYIRPSAIKGTCAIWSDNAEQYRIGANLPHPTWGVVDCAGEPSLGVPPARVHYWCFPEPKKSKAVTSRTNGPGRIAVMFQGELHDWREGIGSNALFARFGIVFGKSRVALIIEPLGDHDEVDSDFARAHVMLVRSRMQVMEHDDALSTWAGQFRAQLPEGVKAIIAEARQESMGDRALPDEMRKRVEEMLRRLRPGRYRRRAGGPVRAVSEIPGAGPGHPDGERPRPPRPPSPDGPPNGPGRDPLLTLLNDNGEEAVPADNRPLPLEVRWETETWINSGTIVGDTDVTDRAGALIGLHAASAEVLALNRDFRGFTRFVDELDRELNPDGDPNLRVFIQQRCEDFTAQKMLEAVLGVRQLENGNQWMTNELRSALGPVALTTTFMADRYHTWQSVKRAAGSWSQQKKAPTRRAG